MAALLSVLRKALRKELVVVRLATLARETYRVTSAVMTFVTSAVMTFVTSAVMTFVTSAVMTFVTSGLMTVVTRDSTERELVVRLSVGGGDVLM